MIPSRAPSPPRPGWVVICASVAETSRRRRTRSLPDPDDQTEVRRRHRDAVARARQGATGRRPQRCSKPGGV